MKSKSILVVEDDYDIRESLKEFLEIEGYHVTTAENGKEALDHLKKDEKPCLVLLDMMMPIMDGRAFIDAVLKDSMLSPLPIFVLSAAATKDNTKGTLGFIKKPADLDLILQMIKLHCP